MSHQNAERARVKAILRKAGFGLPELISRLLKDMRLINKLYSSYAVILVILVIVSAFNLIGINQIGNRTKELYEKRLTAATQILELAGEFHAANAATASMVLQSAEDAQARLSDVESRHERIAGRLTTLAEDMDRYAIHAEDFSSFQMVWNNFLGDWEQIKSGVQTGNGRVGEITGLELARSYYTRNMYNKVEVLNDYLEKWVEANTALAEEAYQAVLGQRNAQIALQTILVLVALLLTGLVGWAVAQSILKPLDMVVSAAGEMAKGKLRQRVELGRSDELGYLAESFNQMAEKIRGLIQEVKNAGDRVSGTSRELSQICEKTEQVSRDVAREVERIADGAMSQMRTAEESARAVNEMAQGVQQIAEASGEVTELAQAAHVEAKTGTEAVQNAVRQIEAVQSTVEGSAAFIRKLDERSGEIGRIVEMITDIAAQTNLLALNASIEAARAGEHGRGFAVVATEVRKLSERSRESANQISVLIQDIRSDMEQAVEAMNRGTREVQEGVAVVKKAGEAFGKIAESVDRVFGKIEGVTAVVEELSASTEEVAASADESARIAKDASDNTQKVADATRDQLSSIGQIASSAGNLFQMARNLQEAISRFEV